MTNHKDETQEVIQILAECANLLEYCEFYAIDLEEIKTNPEITEHIIKKQALLESLIQGYREMSEINQDICQEFLSCDDCEAIIQL